MSFQFFLSLIFLHFVRSSIVINNPDDGVGPLQISVEDIEQFYYNPHRILFVFNRSCVQTLRESNASTSADTQTLIDTVSSTYTDCLNLTNNTLNVAHYDTHDYSYVFFDLFCSIYSMSPISINYTDLCIAYVTYEPLFNASQLELPDSSIQTVPDDTPQFACLRENTDYFESFGVDLLDSAAMDNEYSFPYFTNESVAEQHKIDIHILDSGVQSDHVEFFAGQVIHMLGDGPTVYNNKYGEHGTHVAGIAAGKAYGSARNFSIYDYRVCEFNEGGSDMPCYGHLMFEAMEKVYRHMQSKGKPAVINLSLGGYKSTAIDDAYQYFFEALISLGGVPVVAAGNEDWDACSFSPAYSTAAITVGSYDKHLERSGFSNWGSCVDVWAPGSSIYSSVASSRDNKYAYMSGTSMASPYVAGMVANLLYINPDLSFSDIQQILVRDERTVSGQNCDAFECNRAQYACESSMVYDLPRKLSTLDIVFITFGCVVFVSIVVMVVLCCVKRHQSKTTAAGYEQQTNQDMI